MVGLESQLRGVNVDVCVCRIGLRISKYFEKGPMIGEVIYRHKKLCSAIASLSN